MPSSSRPRRLLLVAVSARMLAGLATDDGLDVVTLDRFGDADLRARCPGRSIAHDLDGVGGMTELVALADDLGADAVVYGAGLENRPDLVERLSAERTLLGTAPDALRVVRDPAWLGAAVARAGLAWPGTWTSGPGGDLEPLSPGPGDGPAPLGEPAQAARPASRGRGLAGAGATCIPASTERPRPADGWLVKPRAGGGGRGVRRWRGGRLRPGELLQREVRGVPVSAVALAARGAERAQLLAVTEQLVGEGALGARGFAWCGNVAPPRLPDEERTALAAQLGRACDLAARLGVVGAFGVDAIWDGARAWVLEVNPRPTAGLEVAGLAGERGLMARHVAACLGAPPPAGAAGRVAPTGHAGRPGATTLAARDPHPAGAPRRGAAKVVVYARREVIAPTQDEWPPGVVDVPHPGSAIPRGAPVCSLLAAADDARGPDALLAELLVRARTLPLRPAGALAGG